MTDMPDEIWAIKEPDWWYEDCEHIAKGGYDKHAHLTKYIRAALNEWQDIATAPDCFNDILLFYPEQEIGDDWFDEDVKIGWFFPEAYDGDDLWHAYGVEFRKERQPTKWKPLGPLPKPPEEKL